MTQIDVLIAVRDEEQSIPGFIERIDNLHLPEDVRLKLVFVEDSSTDETRPLLRRLAAERDDIGYAFLRRGFGQGIALSFALSRSTADAMVMMDVDGSHPPEAIPDLVSAYMAGAQVVQCVRRSLSDRKTYRSLGAALFHRLSRLVFGIDFAEQNIFYRLVSKSAAAMILSESRYWPYLRFPLPTEPAGATIFVEVDSEERTVGESKYNVLRLVALAIDGVLSLISKVRAVSITAAVILMSALFAVANLWPVSIVALGILGRLGFRYFEMGRGDAFQRIEVVESGHFE